MASMVERILGSVASRNPTSGAISKLASDLLSQRVPAVDRTFQAEALDALHRSIEGYPSHDLRMCEVAAWAAHLPQPLVRFAPGGFQIPKERLLHAPCVLPGRQS